MVSEGDWTTDGKRRERVEWLLECKSPNRAHLLNCLYMSIQILVCHRCKILFIMIQSLKLPQWSMVNMLSRSATPTNTATSSPSLPVKVLPGACRRSTNTAQPSHTIFPWPCILWHAKLDLAYVSKQTPQRNTKVDTNVLLHKSDGQGVERSDVFVEAVSREVGIPFQNVNHNRSPRHNVALLSLFIEKGEGADDVCT